MWSLYEWIADDVIDKVTLEGMRLCQ
jgi:hypothetical protein